MWNQIWQHRTMKKSPPHDGDATRLSPTVVMNCAALHDASTTVVDGFFVASWIVVEIEHIQYLRLFVGDSPTSSCSVRHHQYQCHHIGPGSCAEIVHNSVHFHLLVKGASCSSPLRPCVSSTDKVVQSIHPD